jgi:alpha-beta hydrolase superfamily lysophospholipase
MKIHNIKSMSIKCKLIIIAVSLIGFVFVFLLSGLWMASGQVLSPTFNGLTKDLSHCSNEAAKLWGDSCGNLRQSKQYAFDEVKIPVNEGNYDLPGWLVTTKANNSGDARGAVLLVHSGGSDRREDTKHLPLFLGQKLDVLTFDLSCHGEAPCPGHGLTYGYRESRDVIAAFEYLQARYGTVYVMGSSMGATSVLTALPNLNGVAGVIVENPMYSFERLIKDAPEAKSMPGWFSGALIKLAMWRGGFDDSRTPVKSLQATQSAPILFMHSKEDAIVPFKQTQDLAELYKGTKTVWLADNGKHSEVWNANKDEYEKKVITFLNSLQ